MSDQDFILVDEEEKESTGADEVDKEEKKDHLAVKKEEEKETEKDNDDDGYEKDLSHLSQTGKRCGKDDRDAESYYGMPGLYAKKL